jgi:hypothetical protein
MFRFTVRDMLWLIVVVGLAISLLLTTWRMSLLQAKHDALGKQLDAVITVARDSAELNIEVRDDGMRVTMPRGWPHSLVNRWQAIPRPVQPISADAEHPVGRLTK